MKKIYAAALLMTLVCVGCTCPGICPLGSDQVGDLLANAPYKDSGLGKKKLVDNKHLFMMQAALKPGQIVPQHNSNSNVNIIVLDGEIVINVNGKDIIAKRGELVPVAYKSAMNVKNKSNANATFVIIKTPNPSEMSK